MKWFCFPSSLLQTFIACSCHFLRVDVSSLLSQNAVPHHSAEASGPEFSEWLLASPGGPVRQRRPRGDRGPRTGCSVHRHHSCVEFHSRVLLAARCRVDKSVLTFCRQPQILGHPPTTTTTTSICNTIPPPPGPESCGHDSPSCKPSRWALNLSWLWALPTSKIGWGTTGNSEA